MLMPFAIGTTANLTVTGTSARVAIPAGGDRIRVVNVGTQVVYIKIGGSTVDAALTDVALLPNTTHEFTIARPLLAQTGDTHIAAIASTTGSALNITVGH